MKSRFAIIGDARSVERHVLRFETQEGLDEAVRENREAGFLRFRNDGVRLVGRIVRIAPSEIAIEVDAAKDSEKELMNPRRSNRPAGPVPG